MFDNYFNQKENLILVHSFPTNSLLLQGLIDYLAEYFIVYFIDLPGFISNLPPLEDISLDNYSKFVDKKIEKLNLPHYLIGGISFGFTVINNIKPDDRCVGFVAIEPYLNTQSLKMKPSWKTRRLLLLRTIRKMRLSEKLWNSRPFRYLFPKMIFTGHPKKTTDIILNNVNGKTFIETALLLLEKDDLPTFHRKPYILVINRDDDRVGYDYLTSVFRQNIKHLLVIDTTIEHYPKRTLLKSYFDTRFPKEELAEMQDWFSQINRGEPVLSKEIFVPSY